MGRALAALCALLAIGCGAPAASPRDIASEYLRCLGRDPIRTLPLLTEGFHRRHGLHIATAAQARAVAERRAAPEASADLSVDRRQLAWLVVQLRPDLVSRRAALGVAIAEDEASGGTARVTLRVTPPDAPSFEQRFALVRDDGAHWRIDAIEQSGVVAANAPYALATWPNEAARRALAR